MISNDKYRFVLFEKIRKPGKHFKVRLKNLSKEEMASLIPTATWWYVQHNINPENIFDATHYLGQVEKPFDEHYDKTSLLKVVNHLNPKTIGKYHLADINHFEIIS